jgi:hypothetical protein
MGGAATDDKHPPRLTWQMDANPTGRSSLPDLLQSANDEGADVLNRIAFPSEAGRVAAEHWPATGAQYLAQVIEISLDCFHVGIAAVE